MTTPALRGRTVVLGVGAGIAAYKAVEVCRRLVDAGAHTVVVMTPDAQRFVGPMTFSALASEPVATDLWDVRDPLAHTRLGARTDLVVVAPATADLLARYAHGMANEMLAATLLATTSPVVVCPAMHAQMWEHPATQANIALLRARGVFVVEPATGRLAGGDEGVGRLAEPDEIFGAVCSILFEQMRDLAGASVLVTAGGTREPIDPVRFVGNRSSGRQGHAIAAEALARGARVTLVTTSDLPVPGYGRGAGSGSGGTDVRTGDDALEVVRVETAAEMADAVLPRVATSDIVVMAAAVADFRPEVTLPIKHRKSEGPPPVTLVPTRDILAEIGQTRRPDQLIVGFAAETGELLERARAKLVSKGADLIVANDVSLPGVGFSHETNAVTILSADGSVREVPLSGKSKVAGAVLDAVVELRNRRSSQE